MLHTNSLYIPVLVLSAMTLTQCIQFPFTQQSFIIRNTVPNPNSTNSSNTTNPFDKVYYQQVSKFSQPLLGMGIKLLNITNNISGYIQPTLTRILNGWQISVTFTGTWNLGVDGIIVDMIVFENNSDAFESIFVNISAASQNFSISPKWNESNCRFANFILGWHSLSSSKTFKCSILGGGILNCNFSFVAGEAEYLYYNIIIISNNWSSLNCLDCSIGRINATSRFMKPTKMVYNFVCMFDIIASIPSMMVCVDLGDSFELGYWMFIGSGSDAGMQLVVFPASDTARSDPVVTPIQKKQPELSSGPIAGIVIGCLAFIIIVIVIVIKCKQLKQEQNEHSMEERQSEVTSFGPCISCPNQAVKLSNCGHRVLCEKCVDDVKKTTNQCPQCGRKITGIMTDSMNQLPISLAEI